MEKSKVEIPRKIWSALFYNMLYKKYPNYEKLNNADQMEADKVVLKEMTLENIIDKYFFELYRWRGIGDKSVEFLRSLAEKNGLPVPCKRTDRVGWIYLK